jgi:KaiC/GvpD/RAD55 family RecA-like ATPase
VRAPRTVRLNHRANLAIGRIVKRTGEIVRGIIPSGVALLDDWLTGVRQGSAHLLTGGTGSGKSSLALHFAEAGTRRGESVVMLVHVRADDVKSHARFLGLELDAPLRDGRLILLRYRSDFDQRAAQAVSPEQVVSELGRIISPYGPARLVIDTFSPLVTSGLPVAPVMSALADLLEQTGSTGLLAFPEDLSAGYDRNLEPLVQGAAAVIRLTREDTNVRRAELVNIRYPTTSTSMVRFVIRRDVGIVTDQPIREDRAVLSVQ